MPEKEIFKKTSKHRISRNIIIVLAANFCAAGLGFLALMVVSRTLSVGDFGLFNIALSAMLLISSLSSFGLDTGSIRFVSAFLGQDKHSDAAGVLYSALRLRSFLALCACAALFFSAPLLAGKWFGYPQLALLLRVAAAGVLIISLYNFVKAVFFSHRDYRRYAFIQLTVDSAKLGCAFLLAHFSLLNNFSVIAVFAFVPALGLSIGLWRFRKIFSGESVNHSGKTKKLLQYGKWVFTSELLSKGITYCGIFILTRELGSRAAGIYGLGLQLTFFFSILKFSIRSVLLPEASRLRDSAQRKDYLAWLMKVFSAAACMMLPLLFLSRYFIPFFFGQRYAESVGIFNWLALGYILSVVGSPLVQLLYALNKPYLLSYIHLVSLILCIAGTYILIPVFGIAAPAIALLILEVLIIGTLAFLVQRIENEDEPDVSSPPVKEFIPEAAVES